MAARTRRSRPHSYQRPPRLGGARSPRGAASLAALFSVECLKIRTQPERRPGSVWPFRGRRPCSGCALPGGGEPRAHRISPAPPRASSGWGEPLNPQFVGARNPAPPTTAVSHRLALPMCGFRTSCEWPQASPTGCPPRPQSRFSPLLGLPPEAEGQSHCS